MTAMKRARRDVDTRTQFGDVEYLENERRSIVVLGSMGDVFWLNSPSGFKLGNYDVRSGRNPPERAERGDRGHEHTREWGMENGSEGLTATKMATIEERNMARYGNRKGNRRNASFPQDSHRLQNEEHMSAARLGDGRCRVSLKMDDPLYRILMKKSPNTLEAVHRKRTENHQLEQTSLTKEFK